MDHVDVDSGHVPCYEIAGMTSGQSTLRQAVAALLLLAAGARSTLAAETNAGPKTISELQSAIETVLKETKTPGIGIAIVSRDKAEWVTGLGLADVASQRPATAETLFRIGSTSKAFAALAALQLQEQGKLKFTDTVRQWVPDVAFVNRWEATDPVRLVHLMEHTTGFDDIHLREYANNEPTPISLKDALAFGASSRVSRWRPGSRMAYCNSGPAVLAAVIEKVSGQRFENYVQEHLFNPLHMDTATYFYTPKAQKLLATLYHSDGVIPYPYWHICFRPAGSINACAKDMANYVRFYLQRGSLDGTSIVQTASIERMERTESLPVAKLGPIAGYGLYNYTTPEEAFVFHGHDGGVLGGLTEMAYLPEYGLGYAFMINSGSGDALNRIGKLVRQFVIRDLVPPPMPPAARVPAALQQQYAGYYEGISPRVQWVYYLERLLNVRTIVFNAQGLTVRTLGEPPEQWVPTTERLLRRENQSVARLGLLPDTGGETLIQSDKGTFKKVPGWLVWGQIIALCLGLLLMLSSPAFALVWGIRKVIRKLPNPGPWSVRIAPLISVLLLGACFGLFVLNGENLWALGRPSLPSVSIMMLTIAFPVASVWSVYAIYHARDAAMNRVAYWHSALVAVTVAAVALYMGYWGLLGLRLWA